MDQMHQKVTGLRREFLSSSLLLYFLKKTQCYKTKLFLCFKMRHKCRLPKTEESAVLQSSWIALQAPCSLAANNQTSD